MNKKKRKKKIFQKIQETKIHAIRCFPAGSFAVRDHLRSNLGIICGRGSFAALYRPLKKEKEEEKRKFDFCFSSRNSVFLRGTLN